MTQEKVLIVEDEENERTGLAELVRAWGYEAETATDGVEGLQAVEVGTPESSSPTCACRAWMACSCSNTLLPNRNRLPSSC